MLNKISYGNVVCLRQYANKPQGAEVNSLTENKQKQKSSHLSFGRRYCATPYLKNGFLELKNERPNLTERYGSKVQKWVAQFDTAKEQELAYKILKNFVYIDIENARGAYRKIWEDLKDEGVNRLNTNFAILGSSKSNGVAMYLFRQAAQLRSKGKGENKYTDLTGIPRENPFISYSELKNTDFIKSHVKKGRENLVIVDDIIGDGDALKEFLTSDVCRNLSQYKNVYYVTLVKDPDGEKRIKHFLEEKYPKINMTFVAAEEIHKYDSPENHDFSEEEKKSIKELVDKYDKRIGTPELIKKYSRSKLFIAFDWNCPGNTPMMFNYSANGWSALFERYNGLEPKPVSTDYSFYG